MRGADDPSLVSMTKGEYDDIACVVRPLPKDAGFKVIFTPGYAIDMDLKITDNATGEAFANEDPTMNRFIVLMGKWFKEDAEARSQHRGMLNPFTTDELRFMWTFDAAQCEEMRIPSVSSNEVSDRTDYESVDLASLSEDELEIVNPGDA